MLLSTQTDVLGRRHGDEQAIRRIAAAGFDAYDFSFFQMFGSQDYRMAQPDFREYARSLRETADSLGIVCNQAHAPFPSATGDPGKDPWAFQMIVQSMEAASILGAKAIVVHPIHHLSYADHARELREINLDFYRRLIPLCQQFGIRAACENMWQRNKAAGRIIDSTCSRPQEFREYLDALDSPWIVACLDVGHVALTDQDLGFCIRTLGQKHLQALHVHDVDLVEDSHTLPFTQKVDFSQLTSALGEIGYQGDLTFEADNFLRKIPEALEAEGLQFMEKVGRFLIGQIPA